MRPFQCSTASQEAPQQISGDRGGLDVFEVAWTGGRDGLDGAFSGGNQQKIVLARWLLAQSRILLLFDPTRGVDVGTKDELYRLIRAYAAGAAPFCSTRARSPSSSISAIG